MKSFFFLTLLFSSLNAFCESEVFVEKVVESALERNANYEVTVSYFRCAKVPNGAITYTVEDKEISFTSSIKAITFEITGGPYVECYGPTIKHTKTIYVDGIVNEKDHYITNATLFRSK